MTTTKSLPTEMSKYEEVIDWSEKFKPPRANRIITFPAQEYQKWVETLLPDSLASIQPLVESEARTKGHKVGRFIYYLRPLPMWRWGSRWEGLGMPFITSSSMIPLRNKLELYKGSGGAKAYCAFDGNISIPIIGIKDIYHGSIEPWMSLTPNEILTQRGQVKRAKGNVGLAGLGMGWAARRILERKQVKHLTVIEQDLDIIKLFGTPLKEQFGDRLTLVAGDAYNQDWPQFDVSIWDIWENHTDCQFDKEFISIMQQLAEQGKTCVYWGTMA